MSEEETQPSVKKKQYHRISNSFCIDAVHVLEIMCDCALQQKPIPLAVVRSAGFRDLMKKSIKMKSSLEKLRAEKAALKSEHPARPSARRKNLQGSDHAGQDGARDQDSGTQASVLLP